MTTFYNPVDLRDYQSKLSDEIKTAYAGGHRAPLVQLSTGGGKTRLFTHVAAGASGRGRVVLVLAHRQELLSQISGTLAQFNIQHNIVSSQVVRRQIMVEHFKKYGRSFVEQTAKVYVASVQTIVKNLTQILEPNIIIIDEAHHLTDQNQWGMVIAAYPKAKLLPVTASPCRSDGTGLGVGFGGFADAMINGPTMRWLIDQGYLADYKLYAPPISAQIDGFKEKFGDFNKTEVNAAIDKPSVTGDAVEHYLKLAKGLPGVVFCTSVLHAQHVAEQYSNAGIRAKSVDGALDPTERTRRIRGLEDGSVEMLTSADLIGEGLDIPGIVVAQYLRPTQSLSLYMQQGGRPLRPFPGKNFAIILDHVQNIKRHGLPDEEREFSLSGEVKTHRDKDEEGEEILPITCPECHSIQPPTLICTECGHEFKPRKAKEIKIVEGDLVEITGEALEALRRHKRAMQGQAQTVDELVAQGAKRKQAEKIVEAREIKRGLQEDVLDLGDAVTKKTGKSLFESVGMGITDVRRAKPKELKAAIATLQGLLGAGNDNSAAGGLNIRKVG